MNTVRKMFRKINIPNFCTIDEPMSRHTTLKIGGPADLFCTPETINEVVESINLASSLSMPYYVLGEGANVLAADKGVRGVVICLEKLSDYQFINDRTITAGAGSPVTDLAEAALGKSLTGIEFFFGLPGTLGGAVYMNARCYGSSTADVLTNITFLNSKGNTLTIPPEEAGFAYKDSIFQHNRGIILEASIHLRPGYKNKIEKAMMEYKIDREKKGHFAFSSAGSAFKNNRSFGRPTGKIIDSLGLRGFKVGGAQISPLHANIIINKGDASSADVRSLVETVKKKVYEAYQFQLEEEIQYLGEWE